MGGEGTWHPSCTTALNASALHHGRPRVGRILERMTEASRLEQSLRSVERGRYDLAAVVRGCVEGYRVAYPQAAFALELPAGRVEVEGAPDLAAQLLDKLVENAVDFSRGAPVRVALEEAAGSATLSVSNQGPLLPDKMRTRLFESMISVRDALVENGKLAVEGVLLIGEHGNYPRNEKGQILYPRFEMFSQIVAASLLILADRWGDVFLLPGRIALWAVVAIALISGIQYFVLFLRRIIAISGPMPPPEP